MTNRVLIHRGIPLGEQEIFRDEDWNFAFCALEGVRPLDLTDATLELWIRPSFGHATLIHKLTSAAGTPELFIDDAAKAAAHIAMAQADVASLIPASPNTGWSQFLRAVYGSGDKVQIWRRPLIVREARTS
jgi:hypothetical protein